MIVVVGRVVFKLKLFQPHVFSSSPKYLVRSVTPPAQSLQVEIIGKNFKNARSNYAACHDYR
jgi:hypothetical protein